MMAVSVNTDGKSVLTYSIAYIFEHSSHILMVFSRVYIRLFSIKKFEH